jgi:hypothetical protein
VLIDVTLLSFPRYRRRFGVRNLEAHRLANHLLERLEVSGRRPDLQLGVPRTMKLDDDVFAAIVDFKA